MSLHSSALRSMRGLFSMTRRSEAFPMRASSSFRVEAEPEAEHYEEVVVPGVYFADEALRLLARVELAVQEQPLPVPDHGRHAVALAGVHRFNGPVVRGAGDTVMQVRESLPEKGHVGCEMFHAIPIVSSGEKVQGKYYPVRAGSPGQILELTSFYIGIYVDSVPSGIGGKMDAGPWEIYMHEGTWVMKTKMLKILNPIIFILFISQGITGFLMSYSAYAYEVHTRIIWVLFFGVIPALDPELVLG